MCFFFLFSHIILLFLEPTLWCIYGHPIIWFFSAFSIKLRLVRIPHRSMSQLKWTIEDLWGARFHCKSLDKVSHLIIINGQSEDHINCFLIHQRKRPNGTSSSQIHKDASSKSHHPFHISRDSTFSPWHQIRYQKLIGLFHLLIRK